ncbi:hypothetical protein ElyMa_005766800 [Elysia marginata]|uniref:Uncharacterized protein n=1 Tax=Elysia marginata TaxID=1093978 RepID=A0AAV4FPT3_9GAST|nr:hypothetical protein ElyMa_005766800 [Elysia marginata]
MAVRAEYVSSLAQSLADLVEFEIEYSKFSNVEISTATGNTERDTPSTGIRRQGSPVNLGVLSTMVTALGVQSRLVLGERVSMLANSLPDHVTQKLSLITETDQRTGYTYPIMEETTIVALEELSHMLLNVKTTIGCDVHNASENAVATLTTIDTKQEQRPASVDSQILNDPQMFQGRPRAGHKILEDDMLYKPRVTQMYKPRVEHSGP